MGIDDLHPVSPPAQVQFLHHRGVQEPDQVRARADPPARFGKGSSIVHAPPRRSRAFQHQYRPAGPGQVGRGREAVVAAADHDHVPSPAGEVGDRCGQSDRPVRRRCSSLRVRRRSRSDVVSSSLEELHLGQCGEFRLGRRVHGFERDRHVEDPSRLHGERLKRRRVLEGEVLAVRPRRPEKPMRTTAVAAGSRRPSECPVSPMRKPILSMLVRPDEPMVSFCGAWPVTGAPVCQEVLLPPSMASPAAWPDAGSLPRPNWVDGVYVGCTTLARRGSSGFPVLAGVCHGPTNERMTTRSPPGR